jgi:hypothetical protein
LVSPMLEAHRCEVATRWQHSALQRLQDIPSFKPDPGRRDRAFREQTQAIASPKPCS